jgi:hypothetical protein
MNLSDKAIEVIGMSVLAVGGFSLVYLGLVSIRIMGGCLSQGGCLPL